MWGGSNIFRIILRLTYLVSRYYDLSTLSYTYVLNKPKLHRYDVWLISLWSETLHLLSKSLIFGANNERVIIIFMWINYVHETSSYTGRLPRKFPFCSPQARVSWAPVVRRRQSARLSVICITSVLSTGYAFLGINNGIQLILNIMSHALLERIDC